MNGPRGTSRRDGRGRRHIAAPPPRHLRPASRAARCAQVVARVGALAALFLTVTVAVQRARPDEERTGVQALLPAAGTSASTCPGASVEQRAGMVLVVGLPAVTTADDPLVERIAAAGVGGVLLRDDNLLDDEQAEDLIQGLRQRVGESLLVAVDEEGGRVTSLRALRGDTPSARRLGRSGPGAATAAGAELGYLLRSLDVDWVLGPVVDLDGGPSNGVIGDRAFGSDPQTVTETAGAFAAELRRAGVADTLKHFPGHGGDGDPHVGVAVDRSTRGALVREDLVPFETLIALGAETVMVSHVTYPLVWGELPASLEPGAYEMLRSRGFEGVAITDALGMGAVHARWGFDVAPAMAIAAGADAALVNQGDRVDELVAGVVAAVERGDLSEDRLDEAVGRVLELRGEDPLAFCGAR